MGGDGANIMGGEGGERGANISGGSMGGRVQGVPEFPETGGKYYLLHGGDPPKYHGVIGGGSPHPELLGGVASPLPPDPLP